MKEQVDDDPEKKKGYSYSHQKGKDKRKKELRDYLNKEMDIIVQKKLKEMLKMNKDEYYYKGFRDGYMQA